MSGEEMEKDEMVDDVEMEDEDEDDKREKALQAKLSGLHRVLSDNPYDYQTHVEKISVLKALGDLEPLRNARKAFSELYPLSPQLWLDWLRDEQRLASTPKERKEVEALFDKAVKDYLSVDLWIEYCSFALGSIGTSEGVIEAREVFESAVGAVGIHVAKGSLIWGAYRDFEVAVMNMHDSGYEYIYKIFKRQLSIPLLHMEKTLEELKEFRGIPGFQRLYSDTLMSIYENSLKKLEEKESFENNLIKTEKQESENFQVYSEYIQFLRSSSDNNPAQIQNLYERRITDHCLNPLSWKEYCEYLNSELKIGSVSFPIHKRSIRNCPWDGELWAIYLRSLERYGSDQEEITRVFEECLQAGFTNPNDYSKVWVEYLGYVRRRIDEEEIEEKQEIGKDKLRKLFERALDHLKSIPDSDPEMKLNRMWASILGDRFRDMESARKCWSEVVHLLGESVKFWIEYVSLEKLYGDSKHLRKTFLRGMEKIRDDPEYFGTQWTQFELEEGDLSQLESAEIKIKKCLQINEQRRAKINVGDSSNGKSKFEKSERRKDKDKRKDKRRQESVDRKRKLGVAQPDDFKVELEEDNAKRLRVLNDDKVFKAPLPVVSPSETQPSVNSTELNRSNIKPPPGFDKSAVKPPPGFEKEKSKVRPPPGVEKHKSDTKLLLEGKSGVSPFPGFDKQESSVRRSNFDNREEKQLVEGKREESNQGGRRNAFLENESNDYKTVFLSNLDFEVGESDIQTFMESSGSVVDIRLAKNYKGKSRGFAYVEFSNVEEASRVLSRDNELLRNRPVYISECNSLKQGHQFKYSTGLEKNKLFIRGLNFSTTKDDLENLFGKCGELKEIRVATFRNGKSKGIAYVDFIKESDASNAVIKYDGINFQGHVISVSISNPPEKKKELVVTPSLGSGGSRSAMAFLPRSLMRKSNEEEVKNGKSTHVKPKSNADFRNLLLKK